MKGYFAYKTWHKDRMTAKDFTEVSKILDKVLDKELKEISQHKSGQGNIYWYIDSNYGDSEFTLYIKKDPQGINYSI